MDVDWDVQFAEEFAVEFLEFAEDVQAAILHGVHLLGWKGPMLGRPDVDTLKGSKHANMKELRFDADGGVWRLAFAFDPERKAILLVAGDKSGVRSRRFYKKLIEKADQRFDRHLAQLKH
ncbi:MAG: type II toxin-antitoxin system RelE/ParE family toxin [Rhodospirillaceae bacterium]|nr:type II toxin-antitoxin system RelE/ParE family toxin [Rhodospirillaceae bacterium]MCA8934304.1 type II toxin-antitoxin system RelE/ParE family toxin [Rhodospirillaceae bacterium]